jgi:hypothetical protein
MSAARGGVEPLFRIARLRVWPTFARFQRLTVSVCLVFEAMTALLTFRNQKPRERTRRRAETQASLRRGAAQAAGARVLVTR